MKERKSKSCVILGGGSHAGTLIDIIQVTGIAELHAVLDRDSSQWGQDLLGVPVLGNDDLLPELAAQGVTHFAVGVGSTGNNRPREHLFQLGCSYDLKPLTVIHPGAFCSKRTSVGAGAQLFPGSIVNTRATLGNNVIINSGAIVEHDCIIGDHVHVATGAVLASTVRVGKLAHIGAGATVRQLISIGESAVIGAGAVVVGDVTDNAVVGGVPARVMERKNIK
jgi:sugar O-acyltransferase (sialic acid O-acetyltransferase NeuD family)